MEIRRLGHGDVRDQTVLESVGNAFATAATAMRLRSRTKDFGFLFDDFTDAERLPVSAETVVQLKALGLEMRDDAVGQPGSAADPGNADIPAAYTYFGQFVDHDITLDEASGSMDRLSSADLTPLTSVSEIKNTRTATLDLDSVYGGPRDPANSEKMQLGRVVLLNGDVPPILRPPGKSNFNDLPRLGRSNDPGLDRAAQIGDPRNDENIIVAQMHVAFLKAHNSLVDQGMDFEAARRALTLRYQSIVLDDYLARICDPAIHAKVLQYGPSHFKVDGDSNLFMPVEFAFACYRFGHSMVRTKYDYNINFTNVDLSVLFSFTALSGQVGQVASPDGFDTVPDNWIIEWERLLPLKSGQDPQRTRLIDTQLTDFLFKLRNTFGELEGEGKSDEVRQLAPMLARRNLLRGYLIGLPTGQALAQRLGLVPLQGQALLDALPAGKIRTAATPFADRTPLWFYILAEAGDPNGPKGKHLGPLGSTVLMEVFYNLAKHAPISLLNEPAEAGTRPFNLSDLIKLAAKQDPVVAADEIAPPASARSA